jgi:hypothetical protein
LTTGGILMAYLIALVVIWRLTSPLRFTGPIWRLWPDPPARTKR